MGDVTTVDVASHLRTGTHSFVRHHPFPLDMRQNPFPLQRACPNDQRESRGQERERNCMPPRKLGVCWTWVEQRGQPASLARMIKSNVNLNKVVYPSLHILRLDLPRCTSPRTPTLSVCSCTSVLSCISACLLRCTASYSALYGSHAQSETFAGHCRLVELVQEPQPRGLGWTGETGRCRQISLSPLMCVGVH